MTSPASRYGSSTWRQIALDDSLEELWSFTSSMLPGQQLLRSHVRLALLRRTVIIQTKLLPTRGDQYCLSFQYVNLSSRTHGWYSMAVTNAVIRWWLTTAQGWFDKFGVVAVSYNYSCSVLLIQSPVKRSALMCWSSSCHQMSIKLISVIRVDRQITYDTFT